MSSFEEEIIDSILWQIKGLQTNNVTLRATKRILRASLRRIRATYIGCSTESLTTTKINIDHVVPVKTIVDMILNLSEINKETLLILLNTYYCSAKISEHEHTHVLKEAGLASEMP